MKLKLNKKVIVWATIFFILGIMIAPKEVIVDKEIIVEKEVIKEIASECNIENLEKMMIIYEQILNIDGAGFVIAADSILLIKDAAMAGFNQDLVEIERIAEIINNITLDLNALGDNKSKLLIELELLKNK